MPADKSCNTITMRILCPELEWTFWKTMLHYTGTSALSAITLTLSDTSLAISDTTLPLISGMPYPFVTTPNPKWYQLNP